MNVSTTTTTDPINMYDYVNSLVFNPVVFIIILLIIVGYFVLFSSLGNSNESSIGTSGTDADKGQKIIGIIIIAVLVVLIIVNAFQYFFNVNITAYIKDIFSDKPKIDVVVDKSNLESVG
jgi:flagellar biosynthesis protein FlhB